MNELYRGRGYFKTDPLKALFSYFLDDMKLSKFEKYFRKYYFEKLGLDQSKFDDSKIKLFFSYLKNPYDTKALRGLTEYDKLNGFGYYLATKLEDFKLGNFGLSYFIFKDGLEKNFYFFDPDFKIFIGHISATKGVVKNVSGNKLTVVNAAAERKLIGLGYGIKMYLTILENCDYLVSSGILYEGSFRIWAKVLPKYSYVWWKSNDSDTGDNDQDFTRLKPSDNVKPNDIEFFIASIYHKEL